ncbi:MAG: class I SAM-dependent methyltransferase [Rhizonema sp. PD38]|nr:class I SAM-dependent methyltransferase [Rhizonema sp. PD38]
MSQAIYYPDYDLFAREYNEVYGEKLSARTLPILEKLLLAHLPKAASILDLCCGTGQLAQNFLSKGYQVTGLDMSKEMLHYAYKNAPEGKFILGDIYSFELSPIFQGVISMHTLNYVISSEKLIKIFQNVKAVLQPNGLFVFNLQEEYQSFTTHVVRDDYVVVSEQIYNSEEKIAQLNITGFDLIEGNWKRKDTSILEKRYFSEEVLSSLKTVGFREVSIHEPKHGYIYFVSRK